MLRARWYPTLVPLADGRVMAFSGIGRHRTSRCSTRRPGNWTLVTGAARNFPELYPSLHVVPSGEIFYSRAGWAMADTGNTNTGYLSLTGPTSGTWSDLGALQFNDRQEGTAVIQVDTSATPADGAGHDRRRRCLGSGDRRATRRRPKRSTSRALAPAPAWTRTADMHFPRVNVNAVLLPDGTHLRRRRTARRQVERRSAGRARTRDLRSSKRHLDADGANGVPAAVPFDCRAAARRPRAHGGRRGSTAGRGGARPALDGSVQPAVSLDGSAPGDHRGAGGGRLRRNVRHRHTRPERDRFGRADPALAR